MQPLHDDLLVTCLSLAILSVAPVSNYQQGGKNKQGHLCSKISNVAFDSEPMVLRCIDWFGPDRISFVHQRSAPVSGISPRIKVNDIVRFGGPIQNITASTVQILARKLWFCNLWEPTFLNSSYCWSMAQKKD